MNMKCTSHGLHILSVCSLKENLALHLESGVFLKWTGCRVMCGELGQQTQPVTRNPPSSNHYHDWIMLHSECSLFTKRESCCPLVAVELLFFVSFDIDWNSGAFDWNSGALTHNYWYEIQQKCRCCKLMKVRQLHLPVMACWSHILFPFIFPSEAWGST